MTERFKLIYINEQHISANLYDNGIFIGSIENGEELIVEVLNQLSDENEQLQKDCTALIYNNQEYRKENEQLKYQAELLKEELEQCKAVIDNKWSEYLKKKELVK